MQTVTMEGVSLVGTRTFTYGSFKANDGRQVDGGTKHFVYLVEPDELGEPVQVTVPESDYHALRDLGFATQLDVQATAYAKNSKIEWKATGITVHGSGEVLRSA